MSRTKSVEIFDTPHGKCSINKIHGWLDPKPCNKIACGAIHGIKVCSDCWYEALKRAGGVVGTDFGDTMAKVLKKARDNGYNTSNHEDKLIQWGQADDFYNLNDTIFNHEFAKAFFGDEDIYLIDTSPDWAHDMGDTETTWVDEKQLKDYCNAELKSFNKQYTPKQRKTYSFKMLTQSMVSKWEDPFRFAILEMSAWQHHLQELVLLSDQTEQINYLKKFIN